MKKMHYLFALIMLVFSSFCFADEASPASNMVWLVTASALVFLMQAGFALLECGMSRSKNALNVVMKNYMDVCFGTLIFWAIGYGLMFGNNPSGFMGTDLFFMNDSDPASYGVLLFQTMFAATAVTIASGAMAERTRFDGYLVGALFITAVIYPIFGSWVWNADGWLAQMGFIDFAGSTVVHSVGAWTA
ncbi:MAG: Amt family ammonium transporter, partial [Zhongshania aliphaticivorans]